jgi:hypothetical protein
MVIHNYMTRNIGSFRATGGAKDRRVSDCGCGCGGKGDCNHDHSHDDAYAKAELGIDVTYEKGTIGNKIKETRHYTVPSVLVDPRGYGPQPAGVAAELRRQPGHADMIRSGWAVAKTEGYYKREERDTSSRKV